MERILEIRRSNEISSHKDSVFQFSKKSDDRSIDDIKSFEKERPIVEDLELESEYDKLNISDEKLDELADNLIKMAQKELLPEDLIMDNKGDVKAKRLLRWISTKLDYLDIEVFEEETNKKISTRLFARVWAKLKDSDIESQAINRKRKLEMKEKYKSINDNILEIFKQLIDEKGSKILDISDISSGESKKIIKWIAKNLKKITGEKFKKKDRLDKANYAFSLILKNSDKYLDELKKQKEAEEPKEKSKKVKKESKGLSDGDILRLTSSLINRSKREFGHDILQFNSIKSERAKKVASWILSQLDFVIDRDLGKNEKKELASKLFVEICKEVKGKNWVLREMNK